MRPFWSSLTVAVITFFLSSAAFCAVTVKIGSVCANKSGWCKKFDDTQTIPVIHKFTFKAPSAGTALVTLHGSMQCVTSAAGNSVVDFASAIVTKSTAAPTPEKASGLRHAVVLASTPFADAFNLASTLVFKFAAGQSQTFYFKIARLRMDAGTSCKVYNAAFTVEFVPTADKGEVVGQNTCSKSNYCLHFTAGEQPGPARSFDFKAPGKGTAAVTFHGTLYCSNDLLAPGNGGAEIWSEIVTGSANASDIKPGGLQHAVLLRPGTSRTFNLASTRVFSVHAAGTQTYIFKLRRKTITDFNVDCYVYNAAFTVRFVSADEASQIVSQAPCAPANNYCQSSPFFVPDKMGTISFDAPTAGTAIASFHGSAFCESGMSNTYAQFRTQVTTDSNFLPDPASPGGLFQDIFLQFQLPATLNLASSRAVKISAGTHDFNFMYDGQLGFGMTCLIYNAVMTVKFDP